MYVNFYRMILPYKKGTGVFSGGCNHGVESFTDVTLRGYIVELPLYVQ